MLLLVVATVWHLLLPVSPVFSARIPAVLIGATGFTIMMWAWWQFREHRVAICPTDRTDHLIVDGAYRYTRNPMYLGVVTMLLGVALWFGTLPFALAALAFFLVIDRVFCPYEERKLVQGFGEEYERYRSRVRRWI
jgi:protein-S-isoprenylcysteine O-methyltransferase Ste14